jgi:N-hydroxyarylamine O-acetyltransferase
MVDLDAYFARIGYRGDDLATLVDHHMLAIPFENLDVLLGRVPRLDLDGLQAKLVAAKRGGYCFEHATLVAAVLEQLGLPVARHSARVTMMTPRDKAPRTHMFLTVGDVMIDPGFGGYAPRVPIPIGGEAAGYTFHRDGALHVLRMGTQELWVSSLERDHAIDFEMANHYTATHANSPFTTRLMMRAFVPGGRITVMNRDVTDWRGPEPVTTQLADRAALRALLREHFGFDLPEVDRLPGLGFVE